MFGQKYVTDVKIAPATKQVRRAHDKFSIVTPQTKTSVRASWTTIFGRPWARKLKSDQNPVAACDCQLLPAILSHRNLTQLLPLPTTYRDIPSRARRPGEYEMPSLCHISYHGHHIHHPHQIAMPMWSFTLPTREPSALQPDMGSSDAISGTV